MNLLIPTYALYLLISIGLTAWVARTLHRNGRPFLVTSFHGNETLADSVNHLLVVGFYLLNLGFISLTLKVGLAPHDGAAVFEVLGTKIGAVLLILGFLHFINLAIFSRLHRRVPPPLATPAAGTR
ncbi:MAG: putative integral rane protein [Rariglobus sp.]|jgi:hypothetical protein|nr:putative integral rane protein [Rariglobus sp.]